MLSVINNIDVNSSKLAYYRLFLVDEGVVVDIMLSTLVLLLWVLALSNLAVFETAVIRSSH